MNGNSTERGGGPSCCLLQATAANVSPHVSPQSQDVPCRLYMSCPVIDILLLFVGSIFKYSADLEPWCTLECTEHSLAGGRGSSALNLGSDFTFCRSGSQYSQTSLGL